MDSGLQLVELVYSYRGLLAHIVELSSAHVLCRNGASDKIVVFVEAVLRNAASFRERRGTSVCDFLLLSLHSRCLLRVHFLFVVLHQLLCPLLLDYIILADSRKGRVVVNGVFASLRSVQLQI